MPPNISLIAEGTIQLLIVVNIIATINRRGKNPYLMVLGFFFLLFGLLTLFLALVADAPNRFGTAFSSSLLDLLEHEATYYGVAGYLIFQLAMIYGQKALRWPLIGIATLATALVAVHSYHLPILNLSAKNQIFFKILSQQLTIVFFISALVAVTIILVSLLVQFRGGKNQAPLNYVATTCTGIGVMMAALLILKALNPLTGDPMTGMIIFLAYILAFAGFTIQISLISLPGIVYNYETHAPVRLATVRILDKTNHRLIESKVTGANGRYEMLLEEGNYSLQVSAPGYKFPSKKIIGYQGEEIKIKQSALISLDIPLEPIKN